MLGSITTQSIHRKVFRLASQQSAVEAFLQEQGLDIKSTDEMKELLRARGIADSPEELCDAPFKPKPGLQKTGRKSRFSDGSFPVFYSSLEAETAEAEARHLFSKIAGKSSKPRTAYYSRFTCIFDGTAKDLRPKQKDWPKLVHGSDYRFCNELGAEAVKLRLDGLLAPSARRTSGTNLPVFTRRSISKPGEFTPVAMTYDPSTGEVALSDG